MTMALAWTTLALDLAQGAALGIVPSLLSKRVSKRQLALDVGLGIGGCLAMAWFLAPLRWQGDPGRFADPGILPALGSAFAIALGRLIA